MTRFRAWMVAVFVGALLVQGCEGGPEPAEEDDVAPARGALDRGRAGPADSMEDGPTTGPLFYDDDVPPPDYAAVRTVFAPATVEAGEPLEAAPADRLARFAAIPADVVLTAVAEGVVDLPDIAGVRARSAGAFVLEEVLSGRSPAVRFQVALEQPTDQACACVRLDVVPGRRYVLFLHLVEPAVELYRLLSVPRYALGWALLTDDGWVQFTTGSRMTLEDVRVFARRGAT